MPYVNESTARWLSLSVPEDLHLRVTLTGTPASAPTGSMTHAQAARRRDLALGREKLSLARAREESGQVGRQQVLRFKT